MLTVKKAAGRAPLGADIRLKAWQALTPTSKKAAKAAADAGCRQWSRSEID